MLLRLVVSAGLIALGYYMGREVGRLEPLREELRRNRESGERDVLEGDAEEVSEEEPGKEPAGKDG